MSDGLIFFRGLAIALVLGGALLVLLAVVRLLARWVQEQLSR